jgi:hypothetical protein
MRMGEGEPAHQTAPWHRRGYRRAKEGVVVDETIATDTSMTEANGVTNAIVGDSQPRPRTSTQRAVADVEATTTNREAELGAAFLASAASP